MFLVNIDSPVRPVGVTLSLCFLNCSHLVSARIHSGMQLKVYTVPLYYSLDKEIFIKKTPSHHPLHKDCFICPNFTIGVCCNTQSASSALLINSALTFSSLLLLSPSGTRLCGTDTWASSKAASLKCITTEGFFITAGWTIAHLHAISSVSSTAGAAVSPPPPAVSSCLCFQQDGGDAPGLTSPICHVRRDCKFEL